MATSNQGWQVMEAAVQAGRERLYPAISNPNWPVLRNRREIFRRWLKDMRLQKARVLDIGGRIQPYRDLMLFAEEYWSVDIRSTALVNVVARAERLPFADSSVDLVVCTQMIQYATDPAMVAKEVHRVLRPGGVLLLSAPSIFPRDSENDRWRFFPTTLRQLFGIFSELEIAPECGSVAGFLRTVAVSCHSSARYDGLRYALGWSLFPLMNVVGALAEGVMGNKDGSFTVNYSVRATK